MKHREMPPREWCVKCGGNTLTNFVDVDGNPACKAHGGRDAFDKDHQRKCQVCKATPVVWATGLCGPCTWGEAETVGGNW